MKRKLFSTSVILLACMFYAAGQSWIHTAEETALKQSLLMDARLAANEFPKSVYPDGTPENRDDGTWWCSGFFPGTLWELFELTGDPEFRFLADKNTHKLDNVLSLDTSHDIGFQIKCTFLNAYRLTGDKSYLPIIEGAARKLARRYNPNTGTFLSWHHPISGRNWKFPVIIDSMMNLELLMEASKLFGCDSLRQIAISHADKTLAAHFREDYSCFHVVDYDPVDGHVRSQCTHQGYSDESAWARGQAWALYGYTMMYRETGLERYLQRAEAVAEMLLRRLPDDGVPYWDFDDAKIPDTYKDASAAAVMASAFIELSEFTKDTSRATRCLEMAEKQLKTLSSDKYLAPVGQNCNFILMHSVGNLPKNHEVDVPLPYADYYFMEAMVRYMKHKGDLKPRSFVYDNSLTNNVAAVMKSDAFGGTSERPLLSAEFILNQSADGSWPDIDYSDKSRGSWDPAKHLTNTCEIAKTYATTGDDAAKAAAIRALRFWLRGKYESDNWWYNEIRTPRDLLTVCILLGNDLPDDLLDSVLKSVVDCRIDRTGQNRVWLAYNILFRGVLSKSAVDVWAARDAIVREIRITSGHDGIQSDYSYHLHGPQMQMGNYGVAFAQSAAMSIPIFEGTMYEMDSKHKELLKNFMDNGIGLADWKGYYDQNAAGRRWTNYSQKAMSKQLYNAYHYADWKPNPKSGATYFPKSDFGIFRSDKWYCSIRMHSNRTTGFEMMNGENMKGYFTADGALMVRLNGDEYKYPTSSWNWRHIPGTTTYDDGKELNGCDKRPPYNHTDNVGGEVKSDGTLYAYMEIIRDSLHAFKEWTVTKDYILCQGRDIEMSKNARVITTIDQKRLSGDTYVNKQGWIWHQSIVYIPLSKTTFVCNKNSEDTFDLYIDHGISPRGESYSYVIVPGVMDFREARTILSKNKLLQKLDNDKK